MLAASLEQIEKAKELIKKLQFAFRSESFENPVLQHHYASVEAMALDRDTVEEISDFTRMCPLFTAVVANRSSFCFCLTGLFFPQISTVYG